MVQHKLKPAQRATKIIWSVDHRSMNSDFLDYLKRYEVDCLRICFDSGTSEQVLTFLQKFNDLKRPTGERVPVMIDLSSKVRAQLGPLGGPKELQYGDTIELVLNDPVDDNQLPLVCHQRVGDVFRKDVLVFFGYGQVILKVVTVNNQSVTLEVVRGGSAFDDMEIHVPETRPAPTLHDYSDAELESVLSHDIDYLLVPGFESPSEWERLGQICQKVRDNGEIPWFILKINSQASLTKWESLTSYIRGVFLSRLELALTLEPERIPILTKRLIEQSHNNAIACIVASEMLGSMRYNASPTRAEVSDIANVVMDGADAVVVSEEVAAGAYFERAAVLIKKIIEDAERSTGIAHNWQPKLPSVKEEMDAIALGAYQAAQRVGAKAIVCLTQQGNTAFKLASFQSPVPIISVTFNADIERRLAVVRGVSAIHLEQMPGIDDVLATVNDLLAQYSWLKSGDAYVFVTVTLSSLGRQESNLFTIQVLD